MRLRTRLFVAVLLLGLVFAMGVHYGATAGEHWPYPSSDALAEDYDRHVGEQAFLFGTVESVSAGTARLSVESTTGSFPLTVQNFDANVDPGGVMQVLGTLQPDHAMRAEAVRVVNPAGSSTLYKYVTSLVGALLVVVAFFRYWQTDWATLSIEVRADG
jgi:hypothetical protein